MIKLASSAFLLVSAMAGAQTVTVGSTTSTQNGSTTTITVPVSVAVPPAATVTGPVMASLRVEAAGTNQTLGASFKTVTLPNVIADSASGWNASASTYTAPATGTYLIISNVRLADSLPAGISWGQGVGTTNADSPSFMFTTTAGLRNGFVNSRIMQLSAGQTVSLFTYIDSPTPISIAAASLNIQQLQ